VPSPLSRFAQGAAQLVTMERKAPIHEALQLMTEREFSQLPIVGEQGNLLGMVSEQSIVRSQFQMGARVHILKGMTVEDCRDDAITLSVDQDISDALQRLEFTYAIVIVDDDRPIGILTHYDTTRYYRELFEGLVWANDIETTLREYIERAFPSAESLRTALTRAFGTDKRNPSQPARSYNDLSLGDHIQLILTDENWTRFQSVFEPKEVFSSWMDRARIIRNTIAHLRGDTGRSEIDALRRAYGWLKERPRFPDPQLIPLERVPIGLKSTQQRSGGVKNGKYSPFAAWLRTLSPTQARIRVAFSDIESLIGQQLAPTAYEHRTWWANDSVSRSQSKAWLGAGWRVTQVDFGAHEVTFERRSPTDNNGNTSRGEE
jgi:CBS domain protein